MKMIITAVKTDDNLEEVCDQLAANQWGKDNDMAVYTPDTLRKFLSNNQNVLVVGQVKNQIVCSVLCYALDHPDSSRKSLYIDELDTHPDHRRKGYASEMLTWLRAYAAERNLKEVWLTTESEDNDTANSFYKALKPMEALPCNLYSYSATPKK